MLLEIVSNFPTIYTASRHGTNRFSDLPRLKHNLFDENILVAIHKKKTKTKPRGVSPRANYTDRAIAACRRN
jgi:hypothetical protein